MQFFVCCTSSLFSQSNNQRAKRNISSSFIIIIHFFTCDFDVCLKNVWCTLFLPLFLFLCNVCPFSMHFAMKKDYLKSTVMYVRLVYRYEFLLKMYSSVLALCLFNVYKLNTFNALLIQFTILFVKDIGFIR